MLSQRKLLRLLTRIYLTRHTMVAFMCASTRRLVIIRSVNEIQCDENYRAEA